MQITKNGQLVKINICYDSELVQQQFQQFVEEEDIYLVDNEEWVKNANPKQPLPEVLQPYKHTIADDNNQSDYIHLYVIGMCSSETNNLVDRFKRYRFNTLYYVTVEVEDCKSRELLFKGLLQGIQDNTADYHYLREHICRYLNSIKQLTPQLLQIALQAVKTNDLHINY